MASIWDERLDARLLQIRGSGVSFAEVGRRIGVSRAAALGRFHRLNGTEFPSIKDRIAGVDHPQRAGRRWKQERAMKDLELAISCGEDRDLAICRAVEAGGSLRGIGQMFGLTYGRVWQIVQKHKI